MTNDEIKKAIKVVKKIGLDGEDEQSNLGEDFKRSLRTLLHCAEKSLKEENKTKTKLINGKEQE